ncbi:GNAT family N-acetyltransferase [Streptomyces sp. NPDC051907]|uniref:GNAT family N-acetyltransferase n=1 Tax=Streptomyces sp. NPDC051907 TaxID=3155284 RepID=UPI003445E9DC
MSAASAVDYWPASMTTKRLLLRPVELADGSAMARLWTDPEVRRYLGGPVPEDVVSVRQARCVGAKGLFAVVRQQDDELLGSVFVEPGGRDGRTEISYQLAPDHWGFGYAREAVAAAVSWALAEIPAEMPGVVAVTQAANEGSRRLLEALGASLVDHFVAWNAPQVMYRFDQ